MFDVQTLLTRFGAALGLVGGPASAPNSVAKALGYIINAGNPIGAVVPDHIGQILFDNTTGQYWIAYGLTNMSWIDLGDSAGDLLVAHAGGGQANALQLTALVSRVGTVATSGDSVKLPPSAPGVICVVNNHGANPMQVYGQGTDTVDDVATATGVSQMQGSVVIYTCYTAGAWYTEGLATGYSGQFQTFSSTDLLVAHAGGGQALGTPITTMQSRFATVATIADSGLLPVSKPGMSLDVTNAAANSMNIFPAAGEQINALGANGAFALAGTKTAQFICYTAGQWHTLLSA